MDMRDKKKTPLFPDWVCRPLPPDQKYRRGEAEARPAEAGIQLEKKPMCKGYKTCIKSYLTNQSKKEEDIHMGCIGLYTSWRESMVKVGIVEEDDIKPKR